MRRWVVPRWVGLGVALGVVAAPMGLAACVVEGSVGPPGSVPVSGPPPEPMQEAPPPAPNQGAVWVAGYWHWTGMQYTWIPGHWEQAPPGAQWRAPKYSLRDGSYFYLPGSWSRP
jgi:hypothetical protein